MGDEPARAASEARESGDERDDEMEEAAAPRWALDQWDEEYEDDGLFDPWPAVGDG